MKIIKCLPVALLSLIFVIFTACEDEDDTKKPEYGSVSGRVTFIGTFPSVDSGTVRISMHQNWYPTGASYAYKEISPSDLSNNVYEYTFEQVAFGTYKAIAVDYVAFNDTSGNYNIWGVYGGTLQAYFMDADSVVVTTDDPDWTELDFNATIY